MQVSSVAGLVYHESVPASEVQKQKYKDGIKWFALNIEMHQSYLVRIIDKLLQERPPFPVDSGYKQSRPLFLEFLSWIVRKNIGGFTKQVKPPGMSPNSSLVNIFMCVSKTKAF